MRKIIKVIVRIAKVTPAMEYHFYEGPLPIIALLVIFFAIFMSLMGKAG